MTAILLIESSGHRAPLAVAGIGTGLGLPLQPRPDLGDGSRVFVGPSAGAIIGLAVVTMLRQSPQGS